MDQAQKLRELFSKPSHSKSRVITVTGAKGGIGKTCIAVNISLALKKLGYNTLLIDADIGFSNVEIELGTISKYTLYDVLYNKRKIIDIINEGPLGLKYITSGGDFDFLKSDMDFDIFLNNIRILDYYSDFIIIDTGAGINSTVQKFINAADEVLVIITPEPTSIMDAYLLIKNLLAKKNTVINIIVNKAKNYNEYKEVFNRFNSVVSHFIGVKINDFGFLLEDGRISECIKAQIPILIKYQNSNTSKDIMEIAMKISKTEVKYKQDGLMGIFKKIFKR